jgi:hypothetical protein
MSQPPPWEPWDAEPAPAQTYGLDPDDPLVAPPGAGLNAWYERVVASIGRSWRTAAVILGVTHTLPTAAFSALTLAYLGTPGGPFGLEPLTAEEALAFQQRLLEFIGIALLAAVVLTFVQAVGWAAGTWALAREAAGESAPLGQAFSYGLRRAPGLWGWSLLSWLIILAGTCLCVLPGIYLAVGLALIGPVYLFERDSNPVTRSFHLLHANLGPVLGRIALLSAVLIAGQAVAGTVEHAGLSIIDLTQQTALTIAGVVVVVIGAAITLPFAIVQLVGLVVTYAEQAAREAPTTTPRLLAALD